MIIIMLGLPGTGKGTISRMLSEQISVKCVATGDIFRNAIKKQDELGKKVEEYVSSGGLVPDDITVKIIEERIKEPDLKNGVILDGFPRNIEQAKKLDEMLTSIDKEFTLAINLELPNEEIIERVINRRVCSSCGAIYNVKNKPTKVPGICDVCGGNVVLREDDNEETIRKRIELNSKYINELISYYGKKGKVYTVDMLTNSKPELTVESIYNCLKEKGEI